MIIKLPKEVNKIMKSLDAGHFASYTVGTCVRDSLLKRNPYEWDVITSAMPADIKRLFPEAKTVSEKYGIVRMEFIEEVYDKDGVFQGETGIIVDIATFRKEGATFTDKVEEDLARRDFTINAIADSLTDTVDVYQGRKDIEDRIIRTVVDADTSFKASPIRMLKAVRLAAELDFDLHKSAYEGIIANRQLLGNTTPEKIRDEFSAMISSEHAGKGLGMLMDMGLLEVVLGKDVVERLTHREKSDLTVLCNNIDKTKQVTERRLGLFYTCLDKKKSMVAVERLNFDDETEQHLKDAIKDMAKLYFVSQKDDLKKFIYKRGWNRYNYLANLEKAQRIVFEYFNETKIKSKMYLVDEIKAGKEPIFPEDLAVNSNDLVEAGICEAGEAEHMLEMLVEDCHVRPKQNNRKDLLKLAKRFKKYKLAALLRGTHWTR